MYSPFFPQNSQVKVHFSLTFEQTFVDVTPPISSTLLSIFDSFTQTEGADNQRYPDVACDFRIFLLPVLRLLISRNVRQLDWCFKFNEPDAFLTKLMTFLTPVIGKFVEGDPSGLWYSRTLWVRYQREFVINSLWNRVGFSKNNHWALWNRVTKIHCSTQAQLKEILKEFSP